MNIRFRFIRSFFGLGSGIERHTTFDITPADRQTAYSGKAFIGPFIVMFDTFKRQREGKS